MKNFKKFIKNINKINNKISIFFFEIIIKNEVYQIKNSNQIIDFIFFNSDILNKEKNILLKIDIDEIINNTRNLEENISDLFCEDLFSDESEKNIFINFIFEKNLKNKIIDNFFLFLENQIIQNNKNNIIFIKEKNDDNEKYFISEIFKNFSMKIKNLNVNTWFFSEEFNSDSKKEIILDLMNEYSISFPNEVSKQKTLNNLLKKDLFFIYNEIKLFQILSLSNKEINSNDFIFKINKENRDFKIFEILNQLLDIKNFNKSKFVFEFKSLLFHEESKILIIRSMIYFFIKNFELLISIFNKENLIEIINLCFHAEIKLKENQENFTKEINNVFLLLLSSISY